MARKSGEKERVREINPQRTTVYFVLLFNVTGTILAETYLPFECQSNIISPQHNLTVLLNEWDKLW